MPGGSRVRGAFMKVPKSESLRFPEEGGRGGDRKRGFEEIAGRILRVVEGTRGLKTLNEGKREKQKKGKNIQPVTFLIELILGKPSRPTLPLPARCGTAALGDDNRSRSLTYARVEGPTRGVTLT